MAANPVTQLTLRWPAELLGVELATSNFLDREVVDGGWGLVVMCVCNWLSEIPALSTSIEPGP